ncbi:MAG: hypothetical protein A2511_13540 [Deltaproteobacteria bacterium RIFOXYD12_FULL_50_9]|nr:MAG: hypothetical protein A2511_13540 [Deltaproteobacteria bacterium RIFOXYD12_FULL_50_9]
MLSSHLNAIEGVLLAQSKVAKNAGHPNLRGGPREWFIKEFLESHLPSSLMIGQGEVIDVNSPPIPKEGKYRPQIDTVIYRKDLPIISYSRADFAFLIEGVMAVIEIKTNLTKNGVKNFCQSTKKIKSLHCSDTLMGFYKGYFSVDKVASYLVSYDGPNKMEAPANWLNEICDELDINRWQTIDMIVVLGKGVLCKMDSLPPDWRPLRSQELGHNWLLINESENNLYALFSHMLMRVGNTAVPPNISEYFHKNQTENWNSL